MADGQTQAYEARHAPKGVDPSTSPDVAHAPDGSTQAWRSMPAPRVTPPKGHRRPLGQILVDMGALTPEHLAQALARQVKEEALLGDILLANEMVSPEALYGALAIRYATTVADLDAEPPDARLIDEVGVELCIQQSVVPWKRVGGRIVMICARPDQFERVVKRLPQDWGKPRLAVAPDADIQRALVNMRHRHLATRAETRVAEDVSCRTWRPRRAGSIGAAVIVALVGLFFLSPLLGFAVVTAWAVLTLLVNSGIKLVATALYLMAHFRDRNALTPAPSPAPERLPIVSILVPMYREREIAGRLVTRLSALDYPRELLDICLVVEEDDTLTQSTVARSTLPRWMRQITVPRGGVKTKPRALNFALDFCRGSIIGIYDAEDHPESDQIHRVVDHFAQAGPWVACVQGVLDFYNARTNWLSRSFAIEYATWFRITLPGMAKMGFAVPLGGTTVFFRRTAIEALGGWDAHNVTEDADLGMRLARRGFRTEMIGSVTREEANCRWWPWVKQRSRWIKGYAMTYGVHMRDPGQLLADLGLRKFLGFQFLFLGTLSQFLLAPLLWSFWIVLIGLPHPLHSAMPPELFMAMGATFLAAEMLTIVVNLVGVWARGGRFLVPWVPLMHFYYPLASLAALKGLGEIVTKPFYWDKTQHGVADQTREVLDMLTATPDANPV